jgi:hypothetical protein
MDMRALTLMIVNAGSTGVANCWIDLGIEVAGVSVNPSSAYTGSNGNHHVTCPVDQNPHAVVTALTQLSPVMTGLSYACNTSGIIPHACITTTLWWQYHVMNATVQKPTCTYGALAHATLTQACTALSDQGQAPTAPPL